MNNKYINIQIEFSDEQNEIVLAKIAELPFLGIIDNNDNFIVSFDFKEWNEELIQKLQNILKEIDENLNFEIVEEIDERNWNEEWEKEVPAIHINNRIGIAPEWKMSELTEPIQIEINPKMSFGTGHHSTTRLCCKLLDKINLSNQFWIDAGTGTGILAILAIKLGASSVYAFDNNEWSYHNAVENIKANKTEDKISVELFDLDEDELKDCDGITANILAHVIIQNISKFYNALKSKKGTFIASGILTEQENDVLTAAQNIGFSHIETIYEDEWCGIHFEVK
jgi:ribosomal protein L11 methyltransferase